MARKPKIDIYRIAGAIIIAAAACIVFYEFAIRPAPRTGEEPDYGIDRGAFINRGKQDAKDGAPCCPR